MTRTIHRPQAMTMTLTNTYTKTKTQEAQRRVLMCIGLNNLCKSIQAEMSSGKDKDKDKHKHKDKDKDRMFKRPSYISGK